MYQQIVHTFIHSNLSATVSRADPEQIVPLLIYAGNRVSVQGVAFIQSALLWLISGEWLFNPTQLTSAFKDYPVYCVVSLRLAVLPEKGGIMFAVTKVALLNQISYIAGVSHISSNIMFLVCSCYIVHFLSFFLCAYTLITGWL